MDTARHGLAKRLVEELEREREVDAMLAKPELERVELGAVSASDQPSAQLAKRGRGGKRAGAGRKKTGVRRGGPHRRRPELSPKHPVHVTMRIDRNRPELRNRKIYARVRRVLEGFLGRVDFRVVHISIQNNHLHIVVEAADRKALSRNMKSFAIRMQRALADCYGAKLFTHRYHAVQITNARQARCTLAYVLNNWRRHRLDRDDRGRQSSAKLDEFSSAISFTGWRGPSFATPAGYNPLPVSPPSTWLLRSGWRDYGLIDPFEMPGPLQ